MTFRDPFEIPLRETFGPFQNGCTAVRDVSGLREGLRVSECRDPAQCMQTPSLPWQLTARIRDRL